jgi:hypothetical protein
MKKLYDAVVVTGEYEDRQSGQKKKRYLTVGAVFQGDKGPSLKLEALPVAGFNGWINFYEPREREQKPAPQQQAPADEFQDDANIPF